MKYLRILIAILIIAIVSCSPEVLPEDTNPEQTETEKPSKPIKANSSLKGG